MPKCLEIAFIVDCYLHFWFLKRVFFAQMFFFKISIWPIDTLDQKGLGSKENEWELYTSQISQTRTVRCSFLIEFWSLLKTHNIFNIFTDSNNSSCRYCFYSMRIFLPFFKQVVLLLNLNDSSPLRSQILWLILTELWPEWSRFFLWSPVPPYTVFFPSL